MAFHVIPQPSAASPSGSTISPFQAKAALLQAGLLAQVEALIAQSDDLTKLAWAEAQEFRRDSPLLNQLASALGLTARQVDDLFRAARRIRA